jgi:hypothetical protein
VSSDYIVLGNVPEDDYLNTCDQLSGRSKMAEAQDQDHSNITRQSSSHERDGEFTQSCKASVETVELPNPSGDQLPHSTVQDDINDENCPLPEEISPGICTSAWANRTKALSLPLQPTRTSMDVGSNAPQRLSHEATVKRLDEQIEQFGRETQGYDLVGVAQVMVKFEKMVMEVRCFILSSLHTSSACLRWTYASHLASSFALCSTCLFNMGVSIH